jgi:hypothetical protein
MLVRFECPSCQAALRFDPAAVAPRELCPKCGVEIDVAALKPTEPVPPPPTRTLHDATPEEMVEELWKRNLSAVLVYFNPPTSGNFTLNDLRAANVKCVRSGDMDERALHQTLEALGKVSQSKQRSGIALSTGDADQPYEFKGDRLGMGLAEFRSRHARQIPGCSQRLPWCSDESTDQRVAELHSEPWHAAAGIVHARVDLPFEPSPTIAGAVVQRLLYQFVDGKLFRISALFENDHFPAVCEGMISKHGKATSERQRPRQLVWENQSSSIVLTLGSIRPSRPSSLHITHTALVSLADSRKPTRDADL